MNIQSMKYWIAKTLDVINLILRWVLTVAMCIVTIPYLAILALCIGAFVALVTLNDKSESWFGLKKAKLMIEIEKTKNKAEADELKRILDTET